MGIIGENKLTKNALKCWYLRWLSAFVFLLALEIFTAIIATNLLYGVALTIIKSFTIIIPTLFIIALIFIPYLRFINFSYTVNNTEITIYSGIISKTKQRVLLNNIQHIELRAYPFERIYRLATIKIFTSGSEHILPSIVLNHAHLIQKLIYKVAE